MASFNRMRGNGRRIRGYQDGGDAALPDYSDDQTPTPEQNPPPPSDTAPQSPGDFGLLPDQYLVQGGDQPPPSAPGDWANTYAGPTVERPSGVPGIVYEYKWVPGNPALGTPGSYQLAGHLTDPVAAAKAKLAAGLGPAPRAGTDPRSFVLDAVKEYLDAQTEGDRRREAAQSMYEKMAPYALPPGSTAFPGFGVGGPAQQAETLAGARTFSPPTPVMQSVSPQRQAAPMPVDQFVQQMLGRVTG